MNQWRPVWNQFDHLLETVHNEHEYRSYLNGFLKKHSLHISFPPYQYLILNVYPRIHFEYAHSFPIEYLMAI